MSREPESPTKIQGNVLPPGKPTTLSSLPVFRTPYNLADALTPGKPPSMSRHCEIEVSSGGNSPSGMTFYKTEDQPFNKRGFKYKACRPNPHFSSLLYGTSDLPPYRVRLSYFDRSQGTVLDETVTALTTDNGWRSARCNVGVQEGAWYFEFQILLANDHPQNVHGTAHVRIGIGRREASLEAPIGYDAYGYALRDLTGQSIHLSRPKKFLSEGFRSGDVVGFLVELPLLDVQRKIALEQVAHRTPGEPADAETYFGSMREAPDVSRQETAAAPASKKRKKTQKLEEIERNQIADITHEKFIDVARDQIPIKYKNETYFEQFEYKPTGPFEHLLNPVTVFGERAVHDDKPFKPAKLPGSRITVFKNGESAGVAFEDLYAFLPPSSKLANVSQQTEDKLYNNDGSLGYYPMVSVFKKGCVKINPGPHFAYIPLELQQRLDSGDVRCLSERYEETIAEDITYDIVDEVECEYIEGKL